MSIVVLRLALVAAVTALVVLGQPTPTVPPPTTALMSAPSQNVVWTLVAGHLLFRSVDQGATWEQRPLPPGNLPKVSISFVDDHEGWLSAAGSAATQCQFQGVAIWHTADGGGTWQRLDSVGIGGGGCKGAVSFIDSLHGYLDVWDANHQPVMYSTADGGVTWSPSQPLPDPPGATTGPGGFESRADGHVKSFGSTLLVPVRALSGTQLLVYQSDDGGATWTYTASAPLGDTSIGIATDSHWLQLITPGLSQETTDAGSTWLASASDYSQAAPIAPEVVFASSDVGYATVRGRISQTLDGGEHWTTLDTPGTCGVERPCD
jgi:photosystem II stability/assembly factor-like uncharacterized protein